MYSNNVVLTKFYHFVCMYVAQLMEKLGLTSVKELKQMVEEICRFEEPTGMSLVWSNIHTCSNNMKLMQTFCHLLCILLYVYSTIAEEVAGKQGDSSQSSSANYIQ